MSKAAKSTGGSAIDRIRDLLAAMDYEIRDLQARNATLETLMVGMKKDHCAVCRRYGMRKVCDGCAWEGIEKAVSG